MAINVTKPAINLREKLNEVTLETGIKGEELLNSDTSTEARNVLELDTHLFTDFESTGIDDNATSTAITIDASENVGIGTATPDANLKVDGDALEVGLSIGTKTATSTPDIALSGNSVINGDTSLSLLTGAGSFSVRTNTTNRTSGTSAATTRLIIESGTGNTTLNTGNLVIGTSGKGIDFSAVSDGSRSVSSNLLDDYETGTWTPTFLNTTVSSGPNTTAGRYTKIGNTVHVEYFTSQFTPGGGSMKMGGLPFTVGPSSSYSTFHYLHGTAAVEITTGGYFVASNTTIQFIVQGAVVNATWVSAGAELMISGTYTTA